MRNTQHTRESLESALRQSAPPLRTADHARVEKACTRIASVPPLSALREPQTFMKPLLRIAACAALMLGIALLVRPKPQNAAALKLPSVSLNDLTALMGSQNLENTLACEADALAADLACLTAILNDRSLAILF